MLGGQPLRLDHSDFARELSKLGVTACLSPALKPSKRVLLSQNNKKRPKPLGTLLGNLESQLISSSPYARRRSAPASPGKLKRAGFCSPAARKVLQTGVPNQVQLQPLPAQVPTTQLRRDTSAASVSAADVDTSKSGVLRPNMRKQVLTLFQTWAETNSSVHTSRALARPASVSVLGRTRPPSGVSLKPSATSDALPALHGRPRAASAAIRSTGSTSDAALTAKTSSLSFESVLRLYFRLATEEEMGAMLKLVEPQMQRLDKKRWIRRIKAEHTERIRMAFLMGDKDGDGMLSLAEFGEAVALHRGERPGGQGVKAKDSAAETREKISPDELARVFADADKDGNGQLDFDEFLELVASHPKLMKSFEDVLSLAVQRKRDAEHAKLSQIFKIPISPTSRVVSSPSGLRRRPTLADLRSVQEVRLPDDWEM